MGQPLNRLLALALLATLVGTTAKADPLLDEVTDVFMQRGCPGCHMGQTARESLAMFTTSGGTREFLKSLAYRHYALRARVVAAYGEKAFDDFPYLQSPGIDPAHGTFETFVNNLTRDGDEVTAHDRAVIGRWFKAGAPLPQDVQDEVFGEIASFERVVASQRRP